MTIIKTLAAVAALTFSPLAAAATMDCCGAGAACCEEQAACCDEAAAAHRDHEDMAH